MTTGAKILVYHGWVDSKRGWVMSIKPETGVGRRPSKLPRTWLTRDQIWVS